jgi:Fe-S-cluster containining protein
MLCCNGTTIGFVQLEEQEILRVREILEIEEEQGNGFILQPCKKLGCNGCSIYNQRPSQCVKFECELLLSIKDKSITIPSAILIVEDVKRKKRAIEILIKKEKIKLTSKSFYFKAFELRKKMLLTTYPSNNFKTLIGKLEELNLIVTNNFGISF